MSRHASLPPVPRQRSKSVSYVQPSMSAAPPPSYAQVKADPYATGYVPAGLPSWAPYQYPAYHAPQPTVAPQPQGYGYFSWPSTSTVDKIPDEHKGRSRTPAPSTRAKKGGLFSSLRRRVTGPETHLHMLLLHARPSPLLYDVRNPPTMATHGNHPIRALAPLDRAQPATSPPRAFLRLTCELMPWTLEIARPQGVTVGDVLDELHALLHKRVRRSEWLIAADGLQEKVVRTFAWRCYNSTAPRGFEEQQGPKRVDWLLKRTVFRGLSHGPDDDTFVLHLGQH
ncbi:hypothetical protein AURDEDRAFT_117455 [Auricularia subglabra TFB-10046 SS5]|uniref:DUF6699 domain-containing protein n=1 Tax=Auricularia subglabra (strain TFB-10046 / SS5) TaxID=717982 RepID=J0WR21_AURST|nr:hypothetical protein AURDEDRAFT_117455 [Auricularia subglabra TFB-10046 SS5]